MFILCLYKDFNCVYSPTSISSLIQNEKEGVKTHTYKLHRMRLKPTEPTKSYNSGRNSTGADKCDYLSDGAAACNPRWRLCPIRRQAFVFPAFLSRLPTGRIWDEIWVRVPRFNRLCFVFYSAALALLTYKKIYLTLNSFLNNVGMFYVYLAVLFMLSISFLYTEEGSNRPKSVRLNYVMHLFVCSVLI